ncbi:hypothetical protein N7638_15435 [Achromobacter mucicolens]|uniref:hypothetical protein n=1 Tax=Achromobacter mucicolens TaxID=1389922 RepID=UPI0024497D08|nr:hypothetical protein [Achromobacter mucicolens]MDG9969433.1 hypothetical protein [Achromobacter mucicolens]
MVRSILGAASPKVPLNTQVSVNTAARSRLSPLALQARLRKKRSSAYVEAMTRLDAGGHVHGKAATEALMEAIRAEFPDVQIDAWPLGIIAKCFLGAPYEVHTLDATGSIIQHFKRGESLPQGMERARSLACSGHYTFIEVYTDKLIAVGGNGQTAIIDN